MSRRGLLRGGMAAMLALAVAGCGRKGAPQRPKRDDEETKKSED